MQYNTWSWILVNLVNHVVSSIVKELAEGRKFCHQVPVTSMAVINLIMLSDM